ncbi:MAG: hypothetical protein AABZ39_13550 [Spirochaetota bacterium]
MRYALVFLFAAAIFGAPRALPVISIKDQFDRPLSTAPFMRSSVAMLVYRSREASDSSLPQERECIAACRGSTVIRLVDISRAPFFVHGLITGSLRTSEPSNACYLDFDGKAALPFGVPENGVGYFLYTNGVLASERTFVYASNNYRAQFDAFKAAARSLR